MTDHAKEAIVVDETGVGPFQVEVRAGSATFLMDEPVEVGGQGTGPNPYDLLSSALGACTLMTIRLYARRKAWPLERVRLKVTHSRASLDASDHFEREIELIGDLDETQRAKLMDIAMRCPVHLTLERGSQVGTHLAPALGDVHPTTLGDHARDVAEACE
jgi:putative redox protein